MTTTTNTQQPAAAAAAKIVIWIQPKAHGSFHTCVKWCEGVVTVSSSEEGQIETWELKKCAVIEEDEKQIFYWMVQIQPQHKLFYRCDALTAPLSTHQDWIHETKDEERGVYIKFQYEKRMLRARVSSFSPLT